MANLAKYTKCQAGGLTRHFERAKNKDNEYMKFGNQDIDITRTHLNYNLAENKNQLEFINQRCSEVKCLNRKDVNVMCGWVITLPKELRGMDELEDLDDENKFFKECYKFLNNRYGEQNVISAYVHKDETSPHMHYAFVPVVKDKKLGIEKVSAKELLNKRDLQTFHHDLDNHMFKVFGRSVGILNEATKEGNKSIKELKRKTAVERIETVKIESQKIISEAQDKAVKMLNNANLEYSNTKSLVDGLNVEYKAKKGYMKAIKKDSEIGNLVPSYAKVSKKILSGQEYITMPKEKWIGHCKAISEEKKRVENMQKALEQKIRDFQNTISGQNIIIMQNEIKTLKENSEKEKRELIEKYNGLVKKHNNMLESKDKELERQDKKYKNDLKDKDIKYQALDEYVNSVIERLSEKSKEEFLDKWNNLEKYKEQERQQKRQQKSQSRGMSL